MGEIRLYYRYFLVTLKSQLVYRGSFIMTSIAHFFITFIDFIGLWVLFERFENLKGWTLHEVALFYGIIHMSFAFTEAFARGYEVFHRKIRTGEFDRILLRPRSLMVQILGSEFQLMRIGRLLQGSVVFLWGAQGVHVAWSLYKGLYLLLAMAGGVCIFTGIFILQATLSIWSVESLELVNAFSYGGVESSQYPLDIYKKWFRTFFIFVIPLALINYYPLLVLLERPLPSPILVAAPLGSILFLGFALGIFHLGIRHYQSTGS